MNLHQMRDYISKAYPDSEWKRKVRQMPENQVIAIYHTMLKNPNIKHNRRELGLPTHSTKPIIVFPRQSGRSISDAAEALKNVQKLKQLTFDDILRGGIDNE